MGRMAEDRTKQIGAETVVLRTADAGESIGSILRDNLTGGRLIGQFARNDFRTRFAGSYLGIVWAFVQPVVTVFLYWFVFEKALHVGTSAAKEGIAVPYVLWLIAGLVPWFFFSEALTSGTNALLQYSYLVKKVVFRISVLPAVKVVSCLFVHVFFVLFMFLLYTVLGLHPTAASIQVVYYTFCAGMLAWGLSFATSAIAVFFRDLTQIVSILLQVLIWATPIMWNIDVVQRNPALSRILKLTPLYYIVSGYRDAMITGTWFFERPGETLYFWCVTLVILFVGLGIFKRLKNSFADVL